MLDNTVYAIALFIARKNGFSFSQKFLACEIAYLTYINLRNIFHYWCYGNETRTLREHKAAVLVVILFLLFSTLMYAIASLSTLFHTFEQSTMLVIEDCCSNHEQPVLNEIAETIHVSILSFCSGAAFRISVCNRTTRSFENQNVKRTF